jgi:hypothetical protein
VCLGVGHQSGSCDQFFFLIEISPLTRGWVCNLLYNCFWAPGSKVRRTHGYILLSHLRLSQLRGPGPRIYIAQEQSDPVIPPGTGFAFRRLLRLVGLRWRYSNPPPHGSGPNGNHRVPYTRFSPFYYGGVLQSTPLPALASQHTIC